MKTFIAFLVTLLTFGLNNAYAAIGSWEQLQSPGNAVYEIEDENGNSLSINCDTATANRKFYGRMVWYYGEPVGSTNAEDNEMSIAVNGKIISFLLLTAATKQRKLGLPSLMLSLMQRASVWLSTVTKPLTLL